MTKSEWMAKNPQRRAEYEKYLKSAKWKNIRKLVFDRANKTCERCREYFATSVHHLTYERFGNERLADLQAVCGPCHDEADEERVKKQEREFEDYCQEQLEDAQFRGRVRAVYGENVEICPEMWEEFFEWRRGKYEQGE